MKVKTTLLECIRYYPTIFPTRERVLDHLFFVIGNGYAWKGGHLISLTKIKEKDPLKFNLDKFPGSSPKKIKNLKEIIETAEERAKPGFPHIEKMRWVTFKEKTDWNADSLYPLCSYSKIFSVPDNVRPDWLRAAAEAINMGRALGEGIQHPHNLEYLEVAREDLVSRFPQRLSKIVWKDIGPGMDPDSRYAKETRKRFKPRTEEQRIFQEDEIKKLRQTLREKRETSYNPK